MSEDTNRGVFTGQSPTGNFQEALDDAVGQVGQGVAWRLASIDGVAGSFAGNHLNVRIFAVTPAAEGGDAATDPGQPAEVPTQRTGTVTRIPQGTVDICMDGATFLLHGITPGGPQELRLKPTNDEAERELERYADTPRNVTCTGYLRHVECTRLDVYHVDPAYEREHPHAEEPVS